MIGLPFRDEVKIVIVVVANGIVIVSRIIATRTRDDVSGLSMNIA